MAEAVLVPQVGQDLTEAKVVALHVKLGDKVKKGDVVAEVESEKASFEVEAFVAGTVIHLSYGVGDTAKVLEPLMIVGDPGEIVSSSATTSAQVVQPENQMSVDASSVDVAVRSNGKLRSSPLARRIAAAGGVDIYRLDGSGPRGAVVLRDVKSALGGAKLASAGDALTKIAFRNLKHGVGDPIVLIHGFGADVSAWRSFVEHLKSPNPQIGLDLPAHGASPEQRAPNFESIVEDVATALIATGRTRLHLVGHSLGGAVAAALTTRDDLDIRSLTLISPAGLGPKINGDFIEGFLSARSESALKVWMNRLVHDSSRLPGAMIRATFAAREGTGLAAQQRHLAAGVFAGSTQLFSVIEALKSYKGPCRVIVGREDWIIPADQTENLPGHASLNRLHDVGHLPFLEAPGLVGRLTAETIKAAN